MTPSENTILIPSTAVTGEETDDLFRMKARLSAFLLDNGMPDVTETDEGLARLEQASLRLLSMARHGCRAADITYGPNQLEVRPNVRAAILNAIVSSTRRPAATI